MPFTFTNMKLHLLSPINTLKPQTFWETLQPTQSPYSITSWKKHPICCSTITSWWLGLHSSRQGPLGTDGRLETFPHMLYSYCGSYLLHWLEVNTQIKKKKDKCIAYEHSKYLIFSSSIWGTLKTIDYTHKGKVWMCPLLSAADYNDVSCVGGIIGATPDREGGFLQLW